MLERERWARLVRSAGVHADAEEVAISVPAEPSALADAAVVHVGAFYGARRWPEERFAEVARALAQRGEQVVFTGGAEDQARARAVAARAGLPEGSVMAGHLDLTGFAALVAAARLVITADTGAAHLASAYRTPSVVVFGPAPPEEWGPPAGGPHIVLTRAELRRGDAFADEPDPALLAVTAREVIDAIERLRVGRSAD
jgi:ADP-heptose:LPS heptosyltransferase